MEVRNAEKTDESHSSNETANIKGLERKKTFAEVLDKHTISEMKAPQQ